MPHVRQQIREAVAAAVTGLATTGANVHQSRIKPLAAGLPALLVMTNDEAVDVGTINANPVLERVLEVEVAALAKAASNVDDTLDTIAAEVEAVLGNTTLAGLVDSLALSGINVDFDETLDQPAGRLSLRFRAHYFTTANNATTAI
jgi:hypothetical protein